MRLKRINIGGDKEAVPIDMSHRLGCIVAAGRYTYSVSATYAKPVLFPH